MAGFFAVQETLSKIIICTSDTNAYRLNNFDGRDCVQAEYIYLKAFLAQIIAHDLYSGSKKGFICYFGAIQGAVRMNNELLKKKLYELTWGFNEATMQERISEYTALQNPTLVNSAFFKHLNYADVPNQFADFIKDVYIDMTECLEKQTR